VTVIWHSALFVRGFIIENRIEPKKLTIQFTGQGSLFFNELFSKRKAGVTDGMFVTFNDSDHLYGFNELVFEHVLSEGNEHKFFEKYEVRVANADHAKKITAEGALNKGVSNMNNNVNPSLINHLGEVLQKSTDSPFLKLKDVLDSIETYEKITKSLLVLIGGDKFKYKSELITGLQINSHDVGRIEEEYTNMIDIIRMILNNEGNVGEMKKYFGVSSVNNVDSTPLLWPFLKILNNI
jgi:hypothetical protein